MWKKMASFLFFIANAYLCTQLHIYSWTRTGMHVIKQVSSDFIWQEESIVIMIPIPAASTNVFVFYFL